MTQDFLARINYTDFANFLQYGTEAAKPLPPASVVRARIENMLECNINTDDTELIDDIMAEITQICDVFFHDGLQAGTALSAFFVAAPKI